MKKFLVFIILGINCNIAYSQDVRIEDIEKHLEMYADSVRQYNNYRMAESFAYDLLNFINYIDIYGPNSEKTINRFGDVTSVEYTKIVSKIRYDSINMDLWSINLDLSVLKSNVSDSNMLNSKSWSSPCVNASKERRICVRTTE